MSRVVLELNERRRGTNSEDYRNPYDAIALSERIELSSRKYELRLIPNRDSKQSVVRTENHEHNS